MPGDPLPFFAALCLFLSSVEYAVPKPLPFMRLGLANLPVIFAVGSFRFRDIFLLVLLKVLLSSFVSGTTFSYVFLFSAAGSFASGLAVYLLHRLLRACGLSRAMSNVGLCLAGALANNAAQIAVARLLIFGEQAALIAPLLLASGLASGLLLGAFANAFEEKSQFLRAVRGGPPHGGEAAPQSPDAAPAKAGGGRAESAPQAGAAPPLPDGGQPGSARQEPSPRTPRHVAFLLCTAAAMLALPFVSPLPCKAALWLLLLAAAELGRKGKVRLVSPCVLILSLTALSLLSPSGKVLRTVGGLRITDGAMAAGLAKSLTLTGMLFASQALFAAVRHRLPATASGGRPMRPLSRVFACFAALSEHGLDIRGRGGVIASLDSRLLAVWQELAAERAPTA